MTTFNEQQMTRHGPGSWSKRRWLIGTAVLAAIAVAVVLIVVYAGGGGGGGGY